MLTSAVSNHAAAWEKTTHRALLIKAIRSNTLKLHAIFDAAKVMLDLCATITKQTKRVVRTTATRNALQAEIQRAQQLSANLTEQSVPPQKYAERLLDQIEEAIASLRRTSKQLQQSNKGSLPKGIYGGAQRPPSVLHCIARWRM
jgi:hypothetical protein